MVIWKQLLTRIRSFVPPIAAVLVDPTQIVDAQSLNHVLNSVAKAPELQCFAVVIAWKSGPNCRLQFYGNKQACARLEQMNTLLLEPTFRQETLTLDER
jgi:hypothetical protein